jgi:hypothetical protein
MLTDKTSSNAQSAFGFQVVDFVLEPCIFLVFFVNEPRKYTLVNELIYLKRFLEIECDQEP